MEILDLINEQMPQESEMDEKVGKIKLNELSFNSMKRGVKANNDQDEYQSSRWS